MPWWAWTLAITLPLVGGAAAGASLALWRTRRTLLRAQVLKQRARQAERLATIAPLVGGLMHEIKNPLSTLNLNLQLLAEDISEAKTGDDAPRRTARKIEVLREETRRLEEILNRFTAFVGQMKLDRRRLDAGDLVRDLAAFYEPQAAQHGIMLRVSIAEGLPPIEADADLLKQAMLNLMLNAQAAMPEGGELMIHLAEEAGDVVLSITDTGVGIPADRIDKVFDAYYSTRAGGSGLGLPIVRRIVTEHGGTINVSSEPGRGTQFVIRLRPAAQETQVETPR